MLPESAFFQFGISEPGREGGHDESGHSSSSIIPKTLTGLSFITPADPITSNEETYSIRESPDPNQETDSVESLADSDYGGDPIDADESGHSSSSIIPKTLAGLSFITLADSITSNEETYSIRDSPDPNQETDSVESLADSDYGGDPMDADESGYSTDEQNAMDREVYAVIEEAIQTHNLDGVIDSINSIRKSYDMLDVDCVDDLFYWIMKPVLETRHVALGEFNKHIEETLSIWKDVLTYFIYLKHHELDLIRALETICSEIPTSFPPFLKILTCLYENRIVRKHAILYWAQKVGRGYQLHGTFVNQSSKFIKMLVEEPHNRVVPENFFYPEIEEEELFMEQEINSVVRVYEQMEGLQCLYYGHPSNV